MLISLPPERNVYVISAATNISLIEKRGRTQSVQGFIETPYRYDVQLWTGGSPLKVPLFFRLYSMYSVVVLSKQTPRNTHKRN